MATITLPSAHSMNAVYPINIPTPTSSEYYTKTVNLKETAGSFLAEATMLVYDEILRYQRNVEFTHGLDEDQIAKFDYDAFEANVIWFMDEVVGIESSWKKDAVNSESGAYGYVQFLNQASVQTAVNRYRYHIEKFNTRRSGAGYTRTAAVNEWFPPIKTDTYDLYISDIPDVKALPSTNLVDGLGTQTLSTSSEVNGVQTQQFYDYALTHTSSGIDMSWSVNNGITEYLFFAIDLTTSQAGQIQYAFQNELYDNMEKLGFVYSFFDPSTDYTRDDRWEGSNYDDSLVKLVDGQWTYPAYTKTISADASGILAASSDTVSFPAKTTLTASTKRDWNPRGYSDGSRMEYPDWLITLERKVNGDLIGTVMDPGDYDHKRDLSVLNYDEMVALAFVHMHGKTSKDYNFVQLAKGDLAAAKEIYSKNHHTNIDAATEARMEKFFQIH
ncbi:hypothetical protein [uncultured Mediterranean phage]|nr:hypothetical protein [uncultured Mediterranean phage]